MRHTGTMTGARVLRPLPDQVRALARMLEADSQSGGDVRRLQRTGRHSFHYDAARSASGSFRCASPVRVEVTGRQYVTGDATTVAEIGGVLRNAPLWLDIDGRCRRCQPCLEYRRHLWRQRARNEIARSPRTWFVTLTLRPDRQYHYLEVARRRAAARGQDLDTQNPEYVFARRVDAAGKAVTLMLKRLRKNSGCKVRYLMVAERHASGDPHFHLLVHETDLIHVVRKAEFQSQWHEGFSSMKLVKDESAVHYVTKYLAKELMTRVRASLHYGNLPSELTSGCAPTHTTSTTLCRREAQPLVKL